MKKMKMGIAISVAAIAAVAVAAFGGFIWYTNNVEQAAYTTLTADGDFEIRDYPSLVVAEVTRAGNRKSSVNQGFRPLAAYIFAKERKGEPIAMTAPVTQEKRETIAMTAPVTQTPDENGDKWTIRFVMPSNYTRETLPRPAGSDVRIEEMPARLRAVIRFSGVATDSLLAAKEAELRKWMVSRNMRAGGVPTYAYYNAPWTPGFLRRNEVLLDIAAN